MSVPPFGEAFREALRSYMDLRTGCTAAEMGAFAVGFCTCWQGLTQSPAPQVEAFVILNELTLELAQRQISAATEIPGE